jgi:hypothetical protein
MGHHRTHYFFLFQNNSTSLDIIAMAIELWILLFAPAGQHMGAGHCLVCCCRSTWRRPSGSYYLLRRDRSNLISDLGKEISASEKCAWSGCISGAFVGCQSLTHHVLVLLRYYCIILCCMYETNMQ